MSEKAARSLRWWGRTDVGRYRKNNEDAFLALTFDAREMQYLGKIGEATLQNWDYVFAVSDGMGGANAGEYASKVAVDKIAKLLPRNFWLSAQGFANSAQDLLKELFTECHDAILEMEIGRAHV